MSRTALTPPPNFSWVIEGHLAGLGYPYEPGHIEYLLDHGISQLITLTEEEWSPDLSNIQGLNHTIIPVDDLDPPKIEQIIQCTELIEAAKVKNERIALHCFQGRGRTGTMLACYLLKKHSDISPREAIRFIRFIRPGSIETVEQEDIVDEFSEYLRSSRER